MALRRSSVVIAVAGVILIVTAALIRFVALPSLVKLPEDVNATAEFEGTLQQLDPQTFSLDSGTSISIDRTVTANQVVGDTAVITSTAVSHLPAGEVTDEHTYAISRVDYTQVPAPAGIRVEDQKGGITLSLPMDPGTSDTTMYDSVTRTAQPLAYYGSDTLEGRSVHKFSGATTAPIADPSVLEPVKAGIAALAKTGDGTTLPKAVIQSLVPALPSDRALAVSAALVSASDPVPLEFTSINNVDLAVDTRFGGPTKIMQDQTTVLNLRSGNTLIPVVDLSRITVATADTSVATITSDLNKAERQLDLFAIWGPIGLVLVGGLLLLFAFLRRTPRSNANDATASVPPADPADAVPNATVERN